MPKIQMRRDTSANWKSVNPILLSGEWALETDTKKMKIGDGSTAYNLLPYSTAQEDETWQKPADWVDIRSGALPNSIYFLVGHSADYSTYPQFTVKPSISNSGTYDVYVDGVKQATTASGTATTLAWQTLALTSGWDVTYPTALRTHVVRITPTTGTDTITYFALDVNSSTEQGLLWAHDTADNDIVYNSAFGKETSITYKCLLLEAVTTEKGYITCTYHSFHDCSSLKEVPQIKTNTSTSDMFWGCSSLKKVIFLDATKRGTSEYNQFYGCTSLKEIKVLKGWIGSYAGSFDGCGALKALPPCKFTSSGYTALQNILRGCVSLENTVLDLSEGTNLKRLTVGGSSTARIDGLEGITVSSSAPFDHATSPQIDVSYTGLDRKALVNLFNSLPTVTDSQVINITGCAGAADLDATDLAIATGKGWTVTR